MSRLTIVHPSTVPTWRIRTIDYIICSPSFHAQVAMPCQEDGPWEEYDVRQDLKHILGVDHACLLGTSLVAHRRTGLTKTRRRAWKHVPRKMHVTQPHLVEEFVQKVGAGMEMRSFQCKVDGLVNLASAATAPRRPVRYVDPADVKGMCQEPRMVICAGCCLLPSRELGRQPGMLGSVGWFSGQLVVTGRLKNSSPKEIACMQQCGRCLWHMKVTSMR